MASSFGSFSLKELDFISKYNKTFFKYFFNISMTIFDAFIWMSHLMMFVSCYYTFQRFEVIQLQVYSFNLLDAERDYLSMDRRYTRLYVSPECAKVHFVSLN